MNRLLRPIYQRFSPRLNHHVFWRAIRASHRLRHRLQWIAQGETTDWGRVIGRFYSFAHHHRRWTWCYLIWLDADSPSAAWVRADIAWEIDLELLEAEEVR